MPKNTQPITMNQRNIKRFRLIVILFFLSILLPLTLIIYYGYTQFVNEMYFQYRWKASNAVVQINKVIEKRLDIENKRPIADYQFYKLVENPMDWSLQKTLSPLSNPNNYPVDIGINNYFELSSAGKISTPLLPHATRKAIAAENTELDWDEVEKRLTQVASVKTTLQSVGFFNQLVRDEINYKQQNKEQPATSSDQDVTSLVSPFQVFNGDNNALVFYRSVFIGGETKIQGFVADKTQFLTQTFQSYLKMGRFENNVLLTITDNNEPNTVPKGIVYQISSEGVSSTVIANSIDKTLQQQAFYQGSLIAPFQHLALSFSTDSLPLGAATQYVFLLTVILLIIIIVGCVGFYQIGLKQMALAEQRLNFVSSVSHELKTPLTSILMYAEMLKSDMVANEEQKSEYHHFIFDESERLSRLIKNILQLSNIDKQAHNVDLHYVPVEVIIDLIRSKTDSLITKHDFSLLCDIESPIKPTTEVLLDTDAFTQILLNLVDNSVKFYNAANINDPARQKITITFTANEQFNNQIEITLRDYGAGISAQQQNKIFDLFYRCGNELTRTTSGTGIGLALVKQLIKIQQGEISLKRESPGLSFKLTLKARKAA